MQEGRSAELAPASTMVQVWQLVCVCWVYRRGRACAIRTRLDSWLTLRTTLATLSTLPRLSSEQLYDPPRSAPTQL